MNGKPDLLGNSYIRTRPRHSLSCSMFLLIWTGTVAEIEQEFAKKSSVICSQTGQKGKSDTSSFHIVRLHVWTHQSIMGARHRGFKHRRTLGVGGTWVKMAVLFWLFCCLMTCRKWSMLWSHLIWITIVPFIPAWASWKFSRMQKPGFDRQEEHVNPYSDVPCLPPHWYQFKMLWTTFTFL